MTLGERVKARRIRLGLTQADLASLAVVRRPTITELETNRRMTVSSAILKRLARALQCTSDYLIGMYDENETEAAVRALAGHPETPTAELTSAVTQ